MIFWSYERVNRPLESIVDRSRKDQVEAGRMNKNSWTFLSTSEKWKSTLEEINLTSSYQDWDISRCSSTCWARRGCEWILAGNPGFGARCKYNCEKCTCKMFGRFGRHKICTFYELVLVKVFGKELQWWCCQTRNLEPVFAVNYISSCAFYITGHCFTTMSQSEPTNLS